MPRSGWHRLGRDWLKRHRKERIFGGVTAAEVIEHIRTLPPEETAKVVDFVRELDRQAKPTEYASADEAKAAGDRVVKRYERVFRALTADERNAATEHIFNRYDELFKKLSQ